MKGWCSNMKNKKGSKLSTKANGMRFEMTFVTTKAAKKFYHKIKEELNEEEIPIGGKISFKLKDTKVIFKGNNIIAMDLLNHIMMDF